MRFLTTNGVRIAYQVEGKSNAPTVVLVNSLGTDIHLWDQQVTAFSHETSS